MHCFGWRVINVYKKCVFVSVCVFVTEWFAVRFRRGTAPHAWPHACLIKILSIDDINLSKNMMGMSCSPYIGLAKHRAVRQLLASVRWKHSTITKQSFIWAKIVWLDPIVDLKRMFQIQHNLNSFDSYCFDAGGNFDNQHPATITASIKAIALTLSCWHGLDPVYSQPRSAKSLIPCFIFQYKNASYGFLLYMYS